MSASDTEHAIPLDRGTWVRFLRAIGAFISSEVRWRARVLFALLTAFLFAINGLNVVNSYVARDFMTAIADRDRAGFIWQAVVYIGVFVLSTLVAVFYRFVEERLALLWRKWLTRRMLTHYLAGRTYHRVEVYGGLANPDQRITEDTRAFTTTTLSFVLMFLNASFTVVAFASVLWSISPLLFGVAVGYAALGSVMTILLGRPLVWLNYNQLDMEANFRAGLIHVGQHAESIAMLQREGRLGARLLHQLEALTDNWRHIVAVNRNLGFFTTGYNYLIQVIPALVIAPMFIRGDVEFGVITQSAMAFSALLGAFSLIVTQFQSISSFTAVVARLSSLADAFDRAEAMQPKIETVEEAGRVAYEAVTILSSSGGRTLVSELSASVPQGTRLLVVTAHNESCVALFRATAGLWHNGAGRIMRPDLEHIHFLPERPYLPLGTLREGLLRTGREAVVGDGEIHAALQTLGIEDLPDRVGGLDVEKDWEEVFSLGEQQLLSVVRVLLAAPSFVVLDRIMTALDTSETERVLKVLGERGISYIAFGGSEDGRYYDAVLDVAADGTWQWRAVGEGRIPPSLAERVDFLGSVGPPL